MSATVLTTSSLKLAMSSSSRRSSSSSLGLQPLQLNIPRDGSTLLSARSTFRCNSISPTDSTGGSESKSVLDAFFLGKALAEVVNERVESTVGEFLSTIGRMQAKQQKHVQEFKEEVVERATRAQEKATHEAMASQEQIPKIQSVEPPTSPSPGNSTGTDPLMAMLTED